MFMFFLSLLNDFYKIFQVIEQNWVIINWYEILFFNSALYN